MGGEVLGEEVRVLQAILRRRDRQLAVEVENPYRTSSEWLDTKAALVQVLPDAAVRAAVLRYVGGVVWEQAVMELRRAQRDG